MTSADPPKPDRLDALLSELPGLAPLAPPAEFLVQAERLGIAFEAGDLDRLGRFLAMLLHFGRHVNLTAIKEPEEAWMRHVLDSLTLVSLIASTDARTICDVGSGGGLPGLVLASIMPELSFTLIEATGKKASFLESAAAGLKISNVVVESDRAETLGRDVNNHRQKYDLVTARALGNLPVLLELTAPLAKVGGFVLAVKGARAGDEIEQARQALHLLHCRVADTVRTPTGTIVVIEKLRPTPKLYPRRPGEPKRAPLGTATK